MVPQYIQTPERGDHNLTTWNLRAGRYTEAISALEALRRDKGVDVSNNLMWAHVMASKLDDELERETLRMANDHESQASLHAGNGAARAPPGARRGRLRHEAAPHAG
jgi:hypothetical protein